MRRQFGKKNEGLELAQLSLAANMLGKERLQPVKTNVIIFATGVASRLQCKFCDWPSKQLTVSA